MAKKRGNNEGTLYYRDDLQKWVAQVSLDGRRLTKSVDTQKEGLEWIREQKALIDRGLTHQAYKLTVSSFLQRWIRDIKPTLKPKTWNQYRQIAIQHIVPTLGKIKLNDLRPDQIQRLYTQKMEAGSSKRTVQLIHAVLRRALNQALAWGLVTRNPALATNPPKPKKKEMKFYNQSQVIILLAEVDKTRYSALYHLAVTAGLRQGELLGLKWSDIDWENRRIQIQRQAQRVTNEGLKFTDLKTKGSKRSISFGLLTHQKLKEHQEIILTMKAFAGDRWQENDLVFPSTIGTIHEPRNLLRHFKNLIAKIGLPEIRFHDLRHTAATLMFKQGAHPKVVQERLGHASIVITLDTYSHVIPSMQEDIANLLDNTFEK